MREGANGKNLHRCIMIPKARRVWKSSLSVSAPKETEVQSALQWMSNLCPGLRKNLEDRTKTTMDLSVDGELGNEAFILVKDSIHRVVINCIITMKLIFCF